MLKHNHDASWGRRADGCPRCAELAAKPYVLTFKLSTDRKIQRVPVAGVREAQEHLRDLLPATFDRVPVVETPGRQTVAILQVV